MISVSDEGTHVEDINCRIGASLVLILPDENNLQITEIRVLLSPREPAGDATITALNSSCPVVLPVYVTQRID